MIIVAHAWNYPKQDNPIHLLTIHTEFNKAIALREKIEKEIYNNEYLNNADITEKSRGAITNAIDKGYDIDILIYANLG